MRSYSEAEVFGFMQVRYFEEACKIVQRIPRFTRKGKDLRCHELARIVRTHVEREWTKIDFDSNISFAKEVHVIDGKYGIVDHSWLILPPAVGHPRGPILDVYAVGSMPQVQLLDRSEVLRDRTSLFREGELRMDINQDTIDEYLWYYSTIVDHDVVRPR